MIIPTQLELTLVTEQGVLSQKHSPCDIAIASIDWASLPPDQQAEVGRFITPGLDADLCRCPQCSGRDGAQGGIWWVNSQLRERVRTRDIPYRFQCGVGDVALEREA